MWWTATQQQPEFGWLLCRCGWLDPIALAHQRRRRAAAAATPKVTQKEDGIVVVDENVEQWTKQHLQHLTLLAIERRHEEVYARLAVGENQQQHLVLLVPFCRALQTEWDRSVHTYTFCIVADASSGLAENVVQQVLSDAAATTPVWLLQWTTELKSLSRSTRRTILQALCRLHARTIATNVVPLVLPLGVIPHVWPDLTDMFPHDRRVFMYTGCAEASSGAVTTTPTTTIGDSPFLTSTDQLYSALTPLPWRQAVAVEDWMAAVDTLIREQEERIESSKRKNSNSTTSTPPFICRIEYFRDSETAHYAGRALYQYMTGDRRVDAVLPVVAVGPPPAAPTADTLALLQRAAFTHHRILLPHKTLPDTVAPVEHWGLQQAVKGGGCACCGPEDDEDEDDAQENQAPTAPTTTNNFVDGKMSFAFDPTRFAA